MHLKASKSYMPHLDALRGIAALIVVISHSANNDLVPSIFGRGFGQMGVGLFYILSAFLLTKLYLNDTPSLENIRSYTARRIARVLPLFYLVLLASFFLELLLGIPIYRAFDSTQATVNNILLVHGTSVLWSIPVEIHFYIVFIAFWLMSALAGSRAAFCFLVVFQIVFVAIAVAAGFHVHSLPYWMHFFTIGCFAAVGISHEGFAKALSGSGRLRTLMVFALIALTPIALPAVRQDFFGAERLPMFMDLISLLWVVLFFLIFALSYVPYKWVSNSFFRTLGALSFGVYLIHIPVLRAVKLLPLESPPAKIFGFFLVITVTYSLAALANRFFESPMQKRVLRIST